MKIFKSQIPNLLWILVSGFLLLASSYTDAASLHYQSSKTTYTVGESFSVPLILNTEGKQINTISATLDVPLDKLDLLEIRYGNSIISLWVETPQIDRSKGLVSFSGGVPGGFSGSSGPILNLVFRAKRAGTGSLFFQNVDILLNDGQGTKVADLKFPRLNLQISEAPKTPLPEAEEEKKEEKPVEIIPPDTTPPEKFIPLLSRHPDLKNNKYFVSFFAVDKDMGISHYEIHERPLILTLITTKFDVGPVRIEQGPYVLQNQFWPTEVMIRAYDQAGNVQEASATSLPSALFLALLIVAGGLVAAGATFALIRVGYRQLSRPKV